MNLKYIFHSNIRLGYLYISVTRVDRDHDKRPQSICVAEIKNIYRENGFIPTYIFLPVTRVDRDHDKRSRSTRVTGKNI